MPLEPNNYPVRENDTMPNSGIGSKHVYRDHNVVTGVEPYGIQEFLTLGTHMKQESSNPADYIELRESAVEASEDGQRVLSWAFDDLPQDDRLIVLARTVRVPWQFRNFGAFADYKHVLSPPLCAYLANMNWSEQARAANTIPDAQDPKYLFQNGIIDTPTFKGYQLVAELYTAELQLSSGNQSFRLAKLSGAVWFSSVAIPGWRDLNQHMPTGQRVSDVSATSFGIYGNVTHQHAPPTKFVTKLDVDLAGSPPNPSLALTMRSVTPCDTGFGLAVTVPAWANQTLPKPCATGTNNATTGYHPLVANGTLFRFTCTQEA